MEINLATRMANVVRSVAYLMKQMLTADNVLTPTRTIGPSVKLLCQQTQDIMVMHLSRGCMKCCLCNAMDGRENEEEAGNVGSEHERVSSEYETEDGNSENGEAARDDWNYKQSKAGDAEQRLVTSRRKLT
jgi:hypothetical protein